jgi:cell division septum initiation protein DivIVA
MEEENIETLLEENGQLLRKIDDLEAELKLVRFILNETRTIFRVNMLRAFPKATHVEIDEALNSVIKNVGLYKM